MCWGTTEKGEKDGAQAQNRRVAMVKKIGVSFFPIEVNEEMVDMNKCWSTDYKISFKSSFHLKNEGGLQGWASMEIWVSDKQVVFHRGTLIM